VIFLLSERGYDAGCDVLEEIKSLGGEPLSRSPPRRMSALGLHPIC